MKLERMIAERNGYLNEDLNEIETEDGWLIVGELYRWYGTTYRIERITRLGWYGLSADTSLQSFFEWGYTMRNSVNPRRVIAAPYPLTPGCRKDGR